MFSLHAQRFQQGGFADAGQRRRRDLLRLAQGLFQRAPLYLAPRFHLNNVGNPGRQAIGVFRGIRLLARVPGEVKLRGRLRGIGNAVRELPLQRDRLKVVGQLVKDKIGVPRAGRDHGNLRVEGQVVKRLSHALPGRPPADIFDDVVRRLPLKKCNSKHRCFLSLL